MSIVTYEAKILEKVNIELY